MSTNEVYRDAFSQSYDLGSSDPAILSGEFVWISDGLGGVAETDSVLRTAATGGDARYWATIRHIGGFTGTTADAVAVGAAIYLASAATHGTALTTTSSSNKLVGYSMVRKGSGAGNIVVRINK